jgi:KipI family sensor histidine kinase inhibitor
MMRALPYGADAVLLEFADLDEVEAVRDALVAAELPGVAEIVPAARTVLVAFEPGRADPAAVTRLAEGAGSGPPRRGGRDHVIPVHYDGEDLELVANTAGCPVEEVVALHCEARYRVAFCGFAPGFGYLTGLPGAMHQPRLADPRTRVERGSVGIAGEFSAVYPQASPGGWRLVGHTDAVLFDAGAEQPAVLAPGDTVRFERLP